MICKIIVFVMLYCLISGQYKRYITINVPIPGITSPIQLGTLQQQQVPRSYQQLPQQFSQQLPQQRAFQQQQRL